jgi:hypothetical protein
MDEIITSLYGYFLTFALIAAGIQVMLSPKWGKLTIKRIAISAVLFLFGSVLLQSVCSSKATLP